MTALPERMSPSYDHRIFSEKIHQFPKWKESPTYFVWLQSPVQFQDLLWRSQAKDVAALPDICLHPGENPKSVSCDQCISLPVAGLHQIAI